ncbi:DCC1-like thiol-disulfide oxidoreductase family protein [Leptospira biflexa]|uniref:DCC1-like thiol-disulfide oxidoreductase family protein n=1 Tax=Leptospira biflexa TaxID=172 RepID=UPI0010847602|nr:DCC1-like thiol-disulfide oxidoreductase family protein [Leptospira biflexa]TGM36817.1 DUF393 domain-containing protein [Leptospira biflexa]TGM39801.1 DUF393 domain-containing protein [Leptospira biflexa]
MKDQSPIILIYDGNCSFCTNLAKAIESKSINPIQILSYHTIPEESLKKIHIQLTTEKCRGEVQIIQNGNRYPGFFGLRVLLWNVKRYRYIVWILYLPLVPFLGMMVLSILKRTRYWIG